MKIQLNTVLPESMRIGSPFYGQTDFTPLVYLLRGLAKVDEWHYHPETAGNYKPLYAQGVYYEEEPRGQEIWLDVPSLYQEGRGDCEDLGTARAGELCAGTGLVLRGGRYMPMRHPVRRARPGIKWQKRADGSTLIHVVTLVPGSVEGFEDPSRILGMGR